MMNKLFSMLSTAVLLLTALFSGGLVSGAETKMDPNRIAVLYFDNNSGKQEFAPLAKGLCDMMISDMSGHENITIVERTRLQEVLQELDLAKSDKIDQSKAAEIGKLLGAQYLVFGSYVDFMGKFRIDARIVDVSTSKVIVSVGKSGKADEFDILEQSLVADLLEKFDAKTGRENIAASTQRGSSSTGSTKQASREKEPVPPKDKEAKTKKISAASAAKYGQALDKIDSGRKDEAAKILTAVVKENPKFVLASNMLREITND